MKRTSLIIKIMVTIGLLGFGIAMTYANDPLDNNNDENKDFPTNPDVSYANNLVSISSDGHYAVSSNLANQVILWDLQKHTHKIIANHTNSYSAYYIKH
jgi:hypothetical protein